MSGNSRVLPLAQPGDLLDDKYVVEGVTGEGGMGVILAARHIELDTPVAIKVLRQDASHISKCRFLREARTMSQIDCEGIVRVFDVGRLEDGTPYMVMELLTGRDLSDVVFDDGPLEVATAVDYVLQACDALAAAHEHGVVHRDVKPANLFLAERPGGTRIIKLLDFGISKLTSHAAEQPGTLTRTGSFLGSPQFMSPEQLGSSRDVDARTDIWSLAVSLFELLTAEMAFAGETVAEVYSAILRDPPRSLGALRADVPAELEAVLHYCLEKDPELRVQSVAELAALLRPFASQQSDRPVSTLPPPVSERLIARYGRSVPPPGELSTSFLHTSDAHAPLDDDAAEHTPSASVMPVAVTPRVHPAPKGRRSLSVGGALLASGALGAALAVALTWTPARSTLLDAAPKFVVATTHIAAKPTATSSNTNASPFVDSASLDKADRARLKKKLDSAKRLLADGEDHKAVILVLSVMRELGDLGIRPGKAISSLGAQSQLLLGQLEADQVRTILRDGAPRDSGDETVARLDLRLGRARAAYDRVRPWGMRSFFRCGLVDVAHLELATARWFDAAAAGRQGAEGERLMLRSQRHLKQARIVFRHALDVKAETALCVDAAAQGRIDVGRDLAAWRKSPL
jgi:serine/threonine protein kinase